MSALSAVALVGTAYADGAEAPKSHWSGSVSLTSDYRFRGISQTDRNEALQGELQYTGSNGLYAGVWASNVEFPGALGSEVDLYAGYDYALTSDTTIGAEFIWYYYPNATDDELQYYEVIGKIAHQMGGISTSLEVAFGPDVAGQTTLAFTGGVDAKLIDSVYLFSDGISASGHFGHQMFDEVGVDYNFYDIGVTAKISNVALDLRWVDTDLTDAECFGGTNLCEGGFVASVTIALP